MREVFAAAAIAALMLWSLVMVVIEIQQPVGFAALWEKEVLTLMFTVLWAVFQGMLTCALYGMRRD